MLATILKSEIYQTKSFYTCGIGTGGNKRGKSAEIVDAAKR